MDKKQTGKQKLRSGFTTGTTATAAAKAALQMLLKGTPPRQVDVQLLNGDSLIIPVHQCVLTGKYSGKCMVIKDGGDDPDVTNRAEIGARVSIEPSSASSIAITGGQGVGRVTKPGLEVEVGRPAINPGPLKMLHEELGSLLNRQLETWAVQVEIFVPKGEEMAAKTLNARLGILGGISILGTTGVVRPMSHEAYIATIHSALSVAAAMGSDTSILTTGRRSEKFAQAVLPQYPEEAFIQIGDFFKLSLEAAKDKSIHRIIHAIFFGKAIKMAQGAPHTHADKAVLSLRQLGRWTFEITGDRQLATEISTTNTGRQAFMILQQKAPQVIDNVGSRVVKASRGFAGPEAAIRVLIFDFEGQVAYDSSWQ